MTISEKPGVIRILIVDDHPVVRAGLAMTLGKAPDLSICGEAEGVQDALKLIPSARPDLLLVDLDLDGGNGLDLIRETRESRPKVPILMLSMHPEATYAERALRAGAKGYVMKSEPSDRLLSAIREVMAGGIAVSESMKTQVLMRMSGGKGKGNEEDGAIASLSDRELEVFREIGQGRGTRRIAEKLCLSVKTVETHITHIKRKLGLGSGTELQHRAILWTNRKF
jgi:DNA-binding NarL/FixJ family response regulator